MHHGFQNFGKIFRQYIFLSSVVELLSIRKNNRTSGSVMEWSVMWGSAGNAGVKPPALNIPADVDLAL